MPPVTERTLLPVSENGPWTVICPAGRNVVQLHSHVSPTTMRMQDPWSRPIFRVFVLSKTSFANVRMLPTTSFVASPLVTASVAPFAHVSTLAVARAGVHHFDHEQGRAGSERGSDQPLHLCLLLWAVLEQSPCWST